MLVVNRGSYIFNFNIISNNKKYNYSSKNKFLKPTQIKAFAGVEKLTDLKSNYLESRSADTEIQELFFAKIIVHPDYICGKPENDIGEYFDFEKYEVSITDNFFFLLIQPSWSWSFRSNLGRLYSRFA